MIYLWMKAFHIIALVAWMAGLFYLPRLFVYHAEAESGSQVSETFKVMERRLLWGITVPAMVATWLFGAVVAWLGEFWSAPWLHAKVGLVVLMTAFNVWLVWRCRDFALDRNRLSSRTYRVANELPTLLLIAIVILVVVRPF